MKLIANEYGQHSKNEIALESIQFEEKIILAELLKIGFTQRFTSIVFFLEKSPTQSTNYHLLSNAFARQASTAMRCSKTGSLGAFILPSESNTIANGVYCTNLSKSGSISGLRSPL